MQVRLLLAGVGIGSRLGSAVPSRDIPFIVQLCHDVRLPLEQLISSSVGLDSIKQVMDALADGAALR
jgi:alcohol dehydrogenase